MKVYQAGTAPVVSDLLSMTLRDYFAAKAMQALIPMHEGKGGNPLPKVTEAAYQYADAMMKARA